MWKFIPLSDERIERKLVMAFGFMSVIPFLIFSWAVASHADLGVAIYAVAASTLLGYFFVARRMIRSVITVAQQASAIAAKGGSGSVTVQEQNEVGEIARAFNRVTQELEHKVHELESSRQLVRQLLVRIGTAIISYESIDQILALIVENAAIAMEAQMGSLLLVDGEKHELCVKAAWTRDHGQVASEARVPWGEGVVGWVAKEGRPLRGTGTAADMGLPDESQDEGSMLGVPLKLRDRSMGVVIVLRRDRTKAFNDDDEMLLTNIGSQMAVAIENYRLNLDVEQTYLETIVALALAVEAKDPYSAGHSKRVGFYAAKIGEQMGLDAEMLRMLQDAGTLHDVGKIGIRDEILLKQQPLTDEETKIMQQHALIGEAIVKPVRSLQKVVALIRNHHERFDGTGYPTGAKGEDIPLGARILSVADTYDAMITDRPYRKRLSLEEAKGRLKAEAGKQFDPAVVEAFIKVLSDKEERLALSKHGIPA